MQTNDVCPRCDRPGLIRLTPGSGSALEGAPRARPGFLAFLVWPGLAIVCLAGFVPAVLVLATLGIDPARTAIGLHLLVAAAALVAVFLWLLDVRRRRSPSEEEEPETLHYCPWCETP